MRHLPYLFVVAMLAMPFTACNHDVDDVFDRPASNRLNRSAAFYDSLLASAPYGWIMNYYPGDGSYGGCAYTARFSAGNVSLASELRLSDTIDVGTPVVSKYRIIEEQSVVLTFDTYNPLLHYFTEPSQQNVDGWQSDYEFIFMRSSANGDTIFLRGKKYETEMTLRRMSAADANYIERVVRMNRLVMSVPHFYATVDGQPYPIRIDDLAFTYPNASGDTTLVATFTYTPTGIEFFKPITLGGVSFSQLSYNETTGELVSPDGRVVVLFPTNMQQLVNTYGQWNFIVDATKPSGQCDQTLLQAFHRPVGFLCTIEQCFIGRNLVFPDNDPNEYVIGFRYNVFGQYTLYGCYGITLRDLGNNTVGIVGVEKAYGYNDYYFTPITQRILGGSPYHVEFQEGNIQKQIRLTSIKDESIWFCLSCE